jgi:predicted DsbA family dithiol-disulfide isomerase
MNITLVTDIVCPFCYIGFNQMKKALAARPQVDATIGALPFQLDASVAEGGEPFQDYLARRFGDNSQGMLDNATSMAMSEGLELHFDRIETWPNTLKAHKLLEACPSGQRIALYDALFNALFVQGRDIGDEAVLLEIASAQNLDVDGSIFVDEELAMHMDHLLKSCLAMGLNSVPLFIFDEEKSLAGAQGTDAVLKMIDSMA